MVVDITVLALKLTLMVLLLFIFRLSVLHEFSAIFSVSSIVLCMLWASVEGDKIVVSSGIIIILLSSGKVVVKEFMYNKNIGGPSIEPLGIPGTMKGDLILLLINFYQGGIQLLLVEFCL